MAPAPSGKIQLKTTFTSTQTIESIYTGGKATFSPDEKWLITIVGEDIDITEVDTGKKVYRLKGDTEMITTFAIKPDGRYLVSASRSLVMRTWDLSTGQMVRSYKAHEAPIIVMDADRTSTLVATGSADSTVKVWDVDKGYCTHNFKGHGGVVSAIKFHPDKHKWILVSGADDCQVRVWDLMKRSCIAVLESHVSVIRGLDFSHDGWHLISGSRDRVVNVWDLKQKKLLRTFPIYETIETVGLLVPETQMEGDKKPGRELFYTGGDKGVIRVWDLANGELVKEQTQEKNSKHAISDIIYAKKSNRLAAVTSDQNILIYDILSGLRRIKQIVGYNDEVIDVAYLGETEDHLAVATNSEQIRVFNIKSFDCDIIYGHTDIVLCLGRSRDGLVFVSGSKDNTARIWAVNTDHSDLDARYRCAGICVGHTEAVGAVAMSQKTTDFVITGSQDRTIKCWDLSKLDLSGPTSDEEPAKPKSMYTIIAHDKDINSICVAPNDKFLATGSQDKTAKVWNVETGTLLGTCNGHKRGVWCVQFSPVDQVLATSSGDKTIKIWSLKDFSCLKTFEGHTNSILKVAFLTSGMQLVSSGSDGLVKLWTIKTTECVTTLDNHTEKIWGLAVRHDERVVVSGGADSMINFWEDQTEEEMEKEALGKEELILKHVFDVLEQDLQNYLRKKDYHNAILLSLSLNQPHRLLGLFTEIISMREDKDSITGSKSVDQIVEGMTNEQLEKLLTYIRDWNTNAKHARTAQTILNAVLHGFTSEQLLEVNNAKEFIDGLIPYTERHYQRLDDLITQSFIVDYTLHAMDLIDPVGKKVEVDGIEED
ncbi:WD40-repeat-containing domain protein [Jimgerdemannia flammicorona]|uniref:WD40-repeat-containing domain protein n=1 Tax=Jimgerdemannia flammicorona TaxID=994334 RepID=A0A433QYI6_9FUNG|nr:WD40-repeat-containing domain protein [Jimgerdemannia flammicorona]